jgi:hypothetical protein
MYHTLDGVSIIDGLTSKDISLSNQEVNSSSSIDVVIPLYFFFFMLGHCPS